jgi:hypothetical protein
VADDQRGRKCSGLRTGSKIWASTNTSSSFVDNYIDASVLRDLTDQDLEKTGIPLGHRKKLLRGIAVLAPVYG